MVGLLVILVISWMLLHFIEKKNINVLGVIPNQNRILQFVIGFLTITLILLVQIYIETQVKSIKWETKGINYRLIFDAFIYHLKSALTEDLMFRGALLYILISRLGSKWGILISALVFGIYHIFSYGMLGESLVPIIYVILVTGFTGYVWAYIFHKTKSIALGLGLHISYNLVMSCFYISQPYGELLFAEISSENLIGWSEFYYALFKGFFPSIVTLIILKLFLKSNFKVFKIHYL